MKYGSSFILIALLLLVFIGCQADPVTEHEDVIENNLKNVKELDFEDSVDTKPAMIGNTTGNIANGGLAVFYSDSIYFSNGFDGGKIYKVAGESSEITRINNYNSSYLNIIDGQIYYSNLDQDGRIEKLIIDDKTPMTVNNDRSENLIIIDEWIYYINKNDWSRIYRVKTDGTNQEKISEDGVTQFWITEDWIYYINIGGVNTRKIYKIGFDGSGRNQLNEHHSRYINLSDEWIYYTGQTTAFPEPSYIYKMRKDGSESTLICKNDASNINVADGWIYYSNWDDGYSIYKISTDGKQNVKLNDHSSRNINVVSDWIIYKADNEDNTYQMRTDGSEVSKIVDNQFVLLEDIKAAEPYSDIQRAIDAAESGDTVFIEPGIYEGNIDFKGKEIKLLSTDPEDPDIVAATVIKGSGSGSVVTFQSNEGKGAVLSGFTITGGVGSDAAVWSDRSGGGYQYSTWGGGIFIAAESNPIIKNNVIIGNQSKTGGGISVVGESAPEIRNNFIIENEADTGGAISVSWYSSPVVEGNTIQQNMAISGGGISFENYASAIFTGNVISDNKADRSGGGLYVWFISEGLVIEKNSFNGNRSSWGGAIAVLESSGITIKDNNITNNDVSRTGGGINTDSNSIIIDNQIKGNSGNQGGAIFSAAGNLTVKGNIIEYNTSDQSGGGIYINDGSVDILNNIFKENESGESGGGIFIDYYVFTLNVESNDFIRNHALTGGGAIWAIESGEFYRTWAEGVGDYMEAEINISDKNYYFYNEPDNVYLEERKSSRWDY